MQNTPLRFALFLTILGNIPFSVKAGGEKAALPSEEPKQLSVKTNLTQIPSLHGDQEEPTEEALNPHNPLGNADDLHQQRQDAEPRQFHYPQRRIGAFRCIPLN